MKYAIIKITGMLAIAGLIALGCDSVINTGDDDLISTKGQGHDGITAHLSTLSNDVSGDPVADNWVFSGNSMENGVYVRGDLNVSYDIYTTTFLVDNPEVFDISDHTVDEESFYYNYYAGVPSSNLWDPSAVERQWEAGHTVVAVGGKFTDITAEEAGWDEFTGNEVNAELAGNMRYQAKFGTEDATWAASNVAPDDGDGSGSTGDGGNATFLVRTSGWLDLPGDEDQSIGAKHSGEIMGLQQTNHIIGTDGSVNADVVRLIWNWNEEAGYVDSWQILLNTTLVAEDLGEGDYMLTGEGDPVVTTVQKAGGPITDGFVMVAAPEVAEPGARDDCRDGGYEDYGFKNQGQCIRYVNTGQDSR